MNKHLELKYYSGKTVALSHNKYCFVMKKHLELKWYSGKTVALNSNFWKIRKKIS
jgi:hypothetical protein